MFYKLIQRKRDEWYASPNCTIRDFIDYIVKKGEMRDAQVESIRTYLFLKIACHNKPLWELFAEGKFNDKDYELNPEEYGSKTYQTILNSPGAMALLQYAQPNPNEAPVLPKLKELIRIKAEDIDYKAVFKSIFYDEGYTDYVYSLPMGAGKTYLMASFIYIDLYFAQKEEEKNNPVWAHNFMIFAPSGLKSSIVPSLRNIMRFDPSWVIPEPAASKLKAMVKFEILDQQKAAKNSNQIKNPNALKINNHQPYNEMMGLVAITNAEKVILDKVDKKDVQPDLFQTSEWKKEMELIKIANELRDVIGRIPNLAIFVDEVHHVVDKNNKLKKVIEQEWAPKNHFNGMIGFSGTPYLKTPYKITIGTEQPLKDSSMATVVYYYPLMDGIKRFLKTPRIEESDLPSRDLLEKGVRDFLNNYKDVAYDIEGNGKLRKAKLAIFCRSIANLERDVYPFVSQIVAEYGMSASDELLPYHQGGKEGDEIFPAPQGAEQEFLKLDEEDSRKRIILLVRIGQEGWDCKSLTGVILPYEPDSKSSQNSVLQRSCRCLRQAVKHEDETALIWLNRANATYLDQQLKEEQNSSLKELKSASEKTLPTFQRFSRMGRQRVPEIPFYQLELNHVETIDEMKPNTKLTLESSNILTKAKLYGRDTKNIKNETLDSTQDLAGKEMPITFTEWFYLILKEGMHYPDEEMLLNYELQLRRIFSDTTVEREDGHYLSSEYDHEAIRENIRKAFLTERTVKYHKEVIRKDAHIMVIRHDGEIEQINNNRQLADFQTADENKFYPAQPTVNEIVSADNNPQELTDDERKAVETLRKQGMTDIANKTEEMYRSSHKLSSDAQHKDITFQYLPYRFDSDLERNFFHNIQASIHNLHLEIYFNGDENFTSFIIKCYKIKGDEWEALQQYVPDFLVLNRNADGSIDRVLIIETKGQLYHDSFKDKRDYMSSTFLELNRGLDGLPKFDFLYLLAEKDNKNLPQLEAETRERIKTFFNR